MRLIRNRQCLIRVVLAASLVLVSVTGCNTSKYSMLHDERLQQLSTIELVPLNVQVFTIHAGGMLENRPDIQKEVVERLMQNVKEIVTKRGFEAGLTDSLIIPDRRSEQYSQAAALAGAVGEAIRIHHYQFGKQRTIDYAIGDAVSSLSKNRGDAVLFVSLQAAVPTAGRVGLAVTAFVVSLVGANIHVSTNEAIIVLALVDRRTGEVLWYNHRLSKTDVESDRALRNLVKKSCEYLLKPRKRKR